MPEAHGMQIIPLQCNKLHKVRDCEKGLAGKERLTVTSRRVTRIAAMIAARRAAAKVVRAKVARAL